MSRFAGTAPGRAGCRNGRGCRRDHVGERMRRRADRRDRQDPVGGARRQWPSAGAARPGRRQGRPGPDPGAERDRATTTGPAGYKQGESAPLDIRIINNSPVDVRLIGATSPLGTVTPGGAAAPQAAPAATGSPSATPSGAPSANPSGERHAEPAADRRTRRDRHPDPGQSDRRAGPRRSGQYLQITNLTKDLKPGDSTSLSLVVRKPE